MPILYTRRILHAYPKLVCTQLWAEPWNGTGTQALIETRLIILCLKCVERLSRWARYGRHSSVGCRRRVFGCATPCESVDFWFEWMGERVPLEPGRLRVGAVQLFCWKATTNEIKSRESRVDIHRILRYQFQILIDWERTQGHLSL